MFHIVVLGKRMQRSKHIVTSLILPLFPGIVVKGVTPLVRIVDLELVAG